MNRKLILAALVLLALALRWYEIGQLSLAHFDEGVLVSGAFGVWLHGLWHFPLSQPLQAPPLFPWMVAGAFGLTQTPWPIMGIYVSATLGVATVLVYFVLLRRFYGEGLALLGAALLAASDLHVAFSRMALTDVALTFFLVVGAYLVARLGEPESPCSANGRRDGKLRKQLAWGVALGLASGAAWNTKYNGWMLPAVAATTWSIVAGRGWLLRRFAMPFDTDETFARPTALLAIALATLVAVACFVPWYQHVETTFPGGYAAVTRNHLRYVGGFADWPRRAMRLWLSLAAFRHFGWLVTLVGAAALTACWFMRPALLWRGRLAGTFGAGWTPAPQARPSCLAILVVLCGLGAIAVNGGDAVLILVAAVAIGPALIWGRWSEVFFAAWVGAFLVMTPFYHPYTRLLVPALPAVIAVSLWLIAAATSATRQHEPGPPLRSRVAGVCLATACFAALAVGIAFHPFGLIPNRGVWERWSTRRAYRALGDAVLAADLPEDAMVLCQGLPAMQLYIERQWAPLEALPFDRWLPRVGANRPCYLAVDFWGIHGENHQFARASLEAHLRCLTPIAVVPNDLNLPTLLDYLPPAAVASRLAHPLPRPTVADSDGRVLPFPARLEEPFAGIIAIYQIDRECVAKPLDNASSDALQ